jgi:hypothetical protein
LILFVSFRGLLGREAVPGGGNRVDYTDPAIVVNVVVRLVPTNVTAPMITTAINAAIRPYSMAVTPPDHQ